MPDKIANASFSLDSWLLCLLVLAVFAVLAWCWSIFRRDVSIVDSLWSLMFLLALFVYVIDSASFEWRSILILGLVAVWALRLSVYIARRNHGKPEDYRYRAIRKNNEPNFALKSLFIVFGLQSFLAWIICVALLAATGSNSSFNILDAFGIGLWLLGMVFETVGDAQLARFRSDPDNQGKVLDTGLWRYTRHPNYFGEATLWWGYFLLALSAGAAWTVFAPILMTFLLLRVSGVSLLEKNIVDRRPAYQQYIDQTNAFFPGKPSPAVSTQCAR